MSNYGARRELRVARCAGINKKNLRWCDAVVIERGQSDPSMKRIQALKLGWVLDGAGAAVATVAVAVGAQVVA